MNTPMLRSTLAAAMMLAFSGISGAAGLGRINVLSALGQPLRAEVEIAASADDLESMVAKMAAPDAFRRANIEYAGALSGVRMSIDKRSGNAIVKISSDKPFSEPFVDLLIELNWAGGRLLREYTFLLDPVESAGQKSVSTVSGPVAKPIIDSKREQPSREKPTARPVAESVASGEGYTVKSGDTLSRIAAALKPVEVTQDQMVAALYQANRSQFVGENINRLKTGRILKVPQAEEAKQIQPLEARKIILKASNFETYKQTLASSAATGPAKESAAGQSASGKIVPMVEVPAAAKSGRDKVQITATQPDKDSVAESGRAGNKAQIQAMKDDLASRDKALKDAIVRVEDLERNVKELQELIKLKSQALAEAQVRAENAEIAARELTKKAELAGSQPLPTPEASPVLPVVSESVPKQSDSTDVKPAPVVAPPPQPVAVAAPPKPPVVATTEDSGILGNPLAWLGIGVAALGVGYVVLKQRRRSQAPATTQLSDASTTSPNSVFGSAGGQTVDTGGTSLLHTDFSQSGLSAIDADEGVDPVAEADVYMAYGRDAQAEEILLDALKNDPTRTAIYVKLLEIYAQRRSLKQFENIAADLYTQTGGVGDDWAKAAAIGARLDPENPLYKATAATTQKVNEDVLAIPDADIGIPDEESTVVQAAPPSVNFGTNNISQMRSTWTVPGEIGKFAGSAEGAELPVMVELPEEITPAAPATQDSLNLDFNLDLEMAEGEDQHTEVEHRESVASATPAAAAVEADFDAEDTSVSLEFDLGLDDADKAPEPEYQVAGSSDVTVLLPQKEMPSAIAASPSNISLDAVEDLGIERAMVQTSMAVVDLEKTNFEGNLLDFDFELGDEAQKTALDLSDMHLNTQVGSGGGVAAKSAATEAASTEPVSDNIDVDDEVSTKLELARAYEEMGDSEGARELLEEVIADGNGSQQELARTILQRIA